MTHDEIVDLYKKHHRTLKELNKRKTSRLRTATSLGTTNAFRPQFDDVESEIVALLVLEAKPQRIVEFSPCKGWSTCILLDALCMIDTDKPSSVASYDIHDECKWLVERYKPDNVFWNFYLGDVAEQFKKWSLSQIQIDSSTWRKGPRSLSEIDFLFIDLSLIHI